MTLILCPQEIPLDHPDSRYLFESSASKPFVATPAALDRFGIELVVACLRELQAKARQHQGLDYLQVFRDPSTAAELWVIDDGPQGPVTALLPSDY